MQAQNMPRKLPIRNPMRSHILRVGMVTVNKSKKSVSVPGFYIGRGLWVVANPRVQYASNVDGPFYWNQWVVIHEKSGKVVKHSSHRCSLNTFIHAAYGLKAIDWDVSEEYIRSRRELYMQYL